MYNTILKYAGNFLRTTPGNLERIFLRSYRMFSTHWQLGKQRLTNELRKPSPGSLSVCRAM